MARRTRRNSQELHLTWTHLIAIKLADEVVALIAPHLFGQTSPETVDITVDNDSDTSRLVTIKLKMHPVQEVYITLSIVFENRRAACVFSVSLGHGRKQTWSGFARQEPGKGIEIGSFAATTPR